MPTSTERKPAELTPLGEQLLEILHRSGDWMTRRESPRPSADLAIS